MCCFKVTEISIQEPVEAQNVFLRKSFIQLCQITIPELQKTSICLFMKLPNKNEILILFKLSNELELCFQIKIGQRISERDEKFCLVVKGLSGAVDSYIMITKIIKIHLKIIYSKKF